MNIDWDSVCAEAVGHLSQLIRIDTTNPPGNERPAADYLQTILAGDGIESEILESAPRRANLVARIRGGNGSKPPLLLLCHLDVVLADHDGWTHPPFSGAVADDYVWGRGALDMKGMATLELMAMLMVRRLGLRLNRDVIYLATADEETLGIYGASWMVDHHWDKVKAGYVLNEGGQGIAFGPHVVYLVATGEKGYADLWLKAEGRAGHSSIPRADNPVVAIARALARIGAYEPPMRESEAMNVFLDRARAALGIRSYDELAQLARRGRIPPLLLYASRNVFTPTIVMGGRKENVIPAECGANINCRQLPGITESQLVREAESVIADPNITIAVREFHMGSQSPHRTDLFEVIDSVLSGGLPAATVLPYLQPAATDSRVFRSKGVVAYGIKPVVTKLGEMESVHGVNERLSTENVGRGSRLLFEIVSRFCGV